MESVGVQTIARQARGGGICEVSTHGPFAGDSSNGYEYSQSVLEPSVESLDGIAPECGQVFYSKLQDNWYIYLQSMCS